MAANRSPGRYQDMDPPKPRNDAYTGLLSISFVAMLIGCLLLVIDWYSFPLQKPVRPTLPAVKAVNVPKGDPVVEPKGDPKKADEPPPKGKEEMKKEGDAKKDDAKKDDAKKE